MDVEASVDAPPSPSAVIYERCPAAELLKARQVSLSIVDRASDVGDTYQEKSTPFCSSDALARPVVSSAGLVSAESGLPSGSSPEALSELKGIAENPVLDSGFGSKETGEIGSGRKGEGLNVEIATDGAHLKPNDTYENFDLEMGMCALTSLSQPVDEGEPGRLDQHTSSGGTNCRVCYLGHNVHPESGPVIEIGCDCKDDLAFAHRQCAEAWFKIKGNRTCEICGSTVQNIKGVSDGTFIENWNDTDTNSESSGAACSGNHRLLNLLLACIVFAFVLPWIFHVSSFFT